MTERTNTPLSEPPSEQNLEEFGRKFDEFFEGLSEREKVQAASIIVAGLEGEVETPEAETPEAEQVGEAQEMDPLSEEEIEAFAAKLNSFHDSLPEGQHQILDSMVATAFVHSVPEEDRDDVQGHGSFVWTRGVIAPLYSQAWQDRFNDLRFTCQYLGWGGVLKYRYTSSLGYRFYGCWRG